VLQQVLELQQALQQELVSQLVLEPQVPLTEQVLQQELKLALPLEPVVFHP
jgi:hypothetical protein